MLTQMMDNLYIDKLKGSITDNEYDKFYQKFKDQALDINLRLEQLQEAENNYYVTAKYLLDLTNRAYDLFMSSEVEEKRHLIKLILSNLELNDENIVCNVISPFDMILKMSDSHLWLGTLYTFRTFNWNSIVLTLKIFSHKLEAISC